ncbi:MAG TPA: 6-phosphogluconolactonase [Pyrinomonadaceae bacterium]|nr:6-phosphogluconolactonase [Pyrinomonadaceae bacterium]
MKLEILTIAEDWARAAAKVFVARSSRAVAKRGLATVALSGGSTPKLLYQLLADPNEPFREQVPWSKIHFFWTDERHVPPDHPDSNYRMVNEAMLAHVPVTRDNVHRMMSENPNAEEAAAQYERVVPPRFDLILLGLGADGHTASIFPGSEVLHETKRLVAAPWVEKLNSYRITMTLPLINNALSVVFLISGVEKAEVVREVLQTTKRYPAKEVRPNGKLLWLLDKEAASKLKSPEEVTRETIKELSQIRSVN